MQNHSEQAHVHETSTATQKPARPPLKGLAFIHTSKGIRYSDRFPAIQFIYQGKSSAEHN